MRRSWLPFLISTGLGSGCLRPAAGTWGTVAALLLALPVWHFVPESCWWWVFALGSLLFTGLGIIAGRWAIDWYACKDPSSVVIDEWAGMWLTLAVVTLLASTVFTVLSWGIALTFLAFRLFDVVKPWPVAQIESLPGAWGVICDDLAAGVYAAAAVVVVAYVLREHLHISL